MQFATSSTQPSPEILALFKEVYGEKDSLVRSIRVTPQTLIHNGLVYGAVLDFRLIPTTYPDLTKLPIPLSVGTCLARWSAPNPQMMEPLPQVLAEAWRKYKHRPEQFMPHSLYSTCNITSASVLATLKEAVPKTLHLYTGKNGQDTYLISEQVTLPMSLLTGLNPVKSDTLLYAESLIRHFAVEVLNGILSDIAGYMLKCVRGHGSDVSKLSHHYNYFTSAGLVGGYFGAGVARLANMSIIHGLGDEPTYHFGYDASEVARITSHEMPMAGVNAYLAALGSSKLHLVDSLQHIGDISINEL